MWLASPTEPNYPDENLVILKLYHAIISFNYWIMNVMTMELSPGTVISAQLALVCDAEAPVEILPLDGRHDDQVLSILSSGRTFFSPWLHGKSACNEREKLRRSGVGEI